MKFQAVAVTLTVVLIVGALARPQEVRIFIHFSPNSLLTNSILHHVIQIFLRVFEKKATGIAQNNFTSDKVHNFCVD